MRGLIGEVFSLLQLAESRERKRRLDAFQVHLQAVTALVCDLAHREIRSPGGALMVPLAKSALGPKKRPAPFMTESFANIVKDVASRGLGIADLRLGRRSLEGATQSTLQAGPWLRQRLDRLGIGLHDIGRDPQLQGDPLILKSTKVGGIARRLPLPQTAEVERLRYDMHTINAWIASADIQWAGFDDWVDPGERYLRRVFNDGSMDLGGRMWHGFWLGLSKASRFEYLRLCGQRVASLDFANMGVRLAYAEVGAVAPDGDLYALQGISAPREGVKRVLNALLCSDQMPRRFPQDTRRYFHRRVKFAEVLDAICNRHPLLIPVFGTAQSLRQQATESKIMIKALLALRELGIVALPIHDCLLVGVDNVAVCKEALEQAFCEVTGIEGMVDVEEGHVQPSLVRDSSQGSSSLSPRGMFALPLKKGA